MKKSIDTETEEITESASDGTAALKDAERKMSYYQKAASVLDALAKHPFLVTFLACFALIPLCYGAQDNMTPSAKMIWCLLGMAVPAAALLLIEHSGIIGKKTCCFGLLSVFCGGTFLSYFFTRSRLLFVWILVYICLAVFALRASVLGDKRNKDRYNALMIILISFAVKFSYVLYTSCYTRQNDVWSFDGEKGHAAYIEYIFQNLHLPDFRPTSRWQFYHPPLHHSISAGWIHLCETVFGASRNFARESLQLLMLFYSAAAVIIVYKLLKHFGFSGKALVFPLAIFAFHPAYILSSGAINNDQLAALLTVLTILLTVRWTKEPTLRNIMPIALSIGFAMIAKLNAALIAPPVALVFLWGLAKNLKQIKKMFIQFGAFLAVCVPIGLSWTVRNYIRWYTDPMYVPFLGEENQFVGDDIFRRLFDFSPKQFSPVFENWLRKGDAFDEYNPNVAILKNSLFGEDIDGSFFPGFLSVIPVILFWTALVLALAGVVFTVMFMFKKNTRIPLRDKAFLAGFWAFNMYYFYLFCYLYPNTCTQNFRYLYHLLAVSAAEYAMFFDMLQTGERTAAKKTLSRVFSVAIIAFCVLSSVTYLLVGIHDTVG